MNKQVEKQKKRLEKKEKRFLHVKPNKTSQLNHYKEDLAQKIPPKLKNTLDVAFYKGFQLVFEKGDGIIEKTYPKDKLSVEHEINDFTVSRRLVNKGLRKMDGQIMRNHFFNSCATFAEGAGLGLLGIGLPDIPLFIGILLKGIYETAIGYGFDYNEETERVWILRLIRTSLAPAEQKAGYHKEVEDMRKAFIEKKLIAYDFDEELKKTADALSNAMLLMKFVQGLPIVGVFGSVGNVSIYQKTANYCAIQYKSRYLASLDFPDKNK